MSHNYSFLGVQCNYRVTCDDRAWNGFLKRGSSLFILGKVYLN